MSGAGLSAEDYSRFDARAVAGEGPYRCADGWFWIAASRDVLDRLDPAERRIAEARSLQP